MAGEFDATDEAKTQRGDTPPQPAEELRVETATLSVADDTRAWRQLATVTGISGLATLILVLGTASARSGQEPDFDGTPDQVVNFFRSVSTPIADFGSFLGAIGLVLMLWFVVGLALLLSRAEGTPPWRSAIGGASGLVIVISTLSGPWEAAAHRADSLDPQVGLFAFDLGNASFANSWVALGSFAICCGWVLVTSAALPRWLGWVAIVAGAGMVLSRAVWTTAIWFGPYALFWLWVIAVCILLLRHRHPLSE